MFLNYICEVLFFTSRLLRIFYHCTYSGHMHATLIVKQCKADFTKLRFN